MLTLIWLTHFIFGFELNNTVYVVFALLAAVRFVALVGTVPGAWKKIQKNITTSWKVVMVVGAVMLRSLGIFFSQAAWLLVVWQPEKTGYWVALGILTEVMWLYEFFKKPNKKGGKK